MDCLRVICIYGGDIMTSLPQLPNSLQGTQLPATLTVPTVTSTAPVVAAPLPLVPNSALVQNGQSIQQILSKQILTDSSDTAQQTTNNNFEFSKWLIEDLKNKQKNQDNFDFAKMVIKNFDNLDSDKLKIVMDICGGNNTTEIKK